mgnify:FL=1
MAFFTRLFRPARASERRFSELVGPHIETMYRMAWHWTRNTHDAEDLVQDVLIRIVNRLDELEAADKPQPWLIRVLYYRYVDLYRRRQRSPVLPAEDCAEAGSAAEAESSVMDKPDRLALAAQLERALTSLSDDHRDVVLMHDLEGFTTAEIAVVFGISEGTIKSRLHRAREKLKGKLHGSL